MPERGVRRDPIIVPRAEVKQSQPDAATVLAQETAAAPTPMTPEEVALKRAEIKKLMPEVIATAIEQRNRELEKAGKLMHKESPVEEMNILILLACGNIIHKHGGGTDFLSKGMPMWNLWAEEARDYLIASMGLTEKLKGLSNNEQKMLIDEWEPFDGSDPFYLNPTSLPEGTNISVVSLKSEDVTSSARAMWSKQGHIGPQQDVDSQRTVYRVEDHRWVEQEVTNQEGGKFTVVRAEDYKTRKGYQDVLKEYNDSFKE
ncbi:MAG: hypothetical protein ACD_43C00021G0004 [uncultured bacterium]|nr:MAG: hypothetical protein ACD_43C00021G0004 [uncultured bacterium]